MRLDVASRLLVLKIFVGFQELGTRHCHVKHHNFKMTITSWFNEEQATFYRGPGRRLSATTTSQPSRNTQDEDASHLHHPFLPSFITLMWFWPLHANGRRISNKWEVYVLQCEVVRARSPTMTRACSCSNIKGINCTNWLWGMDRKGSMECSISLFDHKHLIEAPWAITHFAMQATSDACQYQGVQYDGLKSVNQVSEALSWCRNRPHLCHTPSEVLLSTGLSLNVSLEWGGKLCWHSWPRTWVTLVPIWWGLGALCPSFPAFRSLLDSRWRPKLSLEHKRWHWAPQPSPNVLRQPEHIFHNIDTTSPNRLLAQKARQLPQAQDLWRWPMVGFMDAVIESFRSPPPKTTTQQS